MQVLYMKGVGGHLILTDLYIQEKKILCLEIVVSMSYRSKLVCTTGDFICRESLCVLCLLAQSCSTLCDQKTEAPQAPLSMGIFRQEY